MVEKVKELTVYGATWCPDAKRTRKFLDTNNINYTWFDVDQDPKNKEFVIKTNGRFVIPTVIFEDGTILTEPSDEELAQKLKSSK
ncbi:MAG: glutaredoxin domain-containing protein [Syntrophaceae bacterium]|nr:glutaredoxin domain-containing protein [Syntrophaceae bacterium]